MQPDAAAKAPNWDARVAVLRQVPERFGTASHQDVYSAIARRVYVPSLAPDFAYVHWRDEYELRGLESAYQRAERLTNEFSNVMVADIQQTVQSEPTTLRVFRLILGFTAQEFAAATALIGPRVPDATSALTVARVRSIEAGGRVNTVAARTCAEVVDLTMRGELFGKSPTAEVRLKTDKPDTALGWESVRQYAKNGVPLEVFLHQRLYGGAFRQLLDATSSKRGDILEDAVAALFSENSISFVRTGSHNQEEISRRFALTVKPAPDFVVFEGKDVLRAMVECKGANDGGTARDKASRFSRLRTETTRLGGVPLFAVLAGLGWTRTADALGPVVRDTDGRTFTIPTLTQMLTVQPFPAMLRRRTSATRRTTRTRGRPHNKA